MDSAPKRRYKALALAGLTVSALAILLIQNGLIIIFPFAPKQLYVVVNLLSFALCWLALYYVLLKFPFYKVLAVIGLLLGALIAEHYLDIQENPITIPLLILFWLGVCYLVLPEFFKKYRVAILSIYGLAIFYYFFLFNTTINDVENHRLNFSNIMLAPIPVFVLLWLYEQWRWLQVLQADKAKAELALLKSQVNPHFFFNTLNNLYGLVVEKSEQAPEVVLKLSDMMRYTIYNGREELVSLTDEVNYLANYIELHKIRYQKKLDLQFTHDLEKEARVAPLLFIILLENAFKHGAERLTENAYIHLNLSMRDNQVLFTIENRYDPTLAAQKPGIGLNNLQQRLTHLYPNRHSLKVDKTDTKYTAHLQLALSA